MSGSKRHFVTRNLSMNSLQGTLKKKTGKSRFSHTPFLISQTEVTQGLNYSCPVSVCSGRHIGYVTTLIYGRVRRFHLLLAASKVELTKTRQLASSRFG